MAEERIIRDCDEFDLNSNSVLVTHLCPNCKVWGKCSIHQSKDVENYSHVCDSCDHKWKQYTDEDIIQHRKVTPILKRKK